MVFFALLSFFIIISFYEKQEYKTVLLPVGLETLTDAQIHLFF